jgi:outer membrane protein assembly factor BamB
MKEKVMKTQELMFVGIKGCVVALRRDSGEQAWVAKVAGGFVNVTVESGKVFAAAQGEIFCLDPLTGRQLWHNPLKGYGTGLATMAFSGGSSGTGTAVMAQKISEDEAAAASAGAAVAVTA